MNINFATATPEEINAYIAYVKELETKVNSTKKTNKTTKLLEDLQEIFNNYSEYSNTNKLLWLYFLLSILFSSLDIPVLELLDKLETEPEEDDIKKIIILQIKELIKSDEFKLRKPNKKITPIVEVKEPVVNNPLL